MNLKKLTSIAQNWILALIFLVAFFAAQGLVHAQTSSGYTIGQLQQQSSVIRGVVLQARDVQVAGSSRAEMAGGLVGGLAGAYATRNSGWQGQAAAASIVGLIGSAIGGSVGGSSGQELIIRTDGGSVVSVAQSSSDGVHFFNGQRVLLLGAGRVVPETGY